MTPDDWAMAAFMAIGLGALLLRRYLDFRTARRELIARMMEGSTHDHSSTEG